MKPSHPPRKRQAFTAYLSSTLSDLTAERKAVQEALSDQCVIKHSYLASESDLVKSCLEDVAGCELYIGVVGLRYGHVPDPRIFANPDGLSITELEYRHAVHKNIPRHIFLKCEDAIAVTHTDLKSRQHPPERIEALRNELQSSQGHRVAIFSTADELKLAVVKAFNEFRERRKTAAERVPRQPRPVSHDAVRAGYLEWLREACEKVVLLGMNARERQNVRLGEIYVPAVTPHRERAAARARADHDAPSHDLLLQHLAKESLYVPGAPGAGKSTFCRWLALAVSQGVLPHHSIPTPEPFKETLPKGWHGRFPFYCRLREWVSDARATYLEGNGEWRRKRLEDSLAAWIEATQPGGLTGAAFLDALARGKCLLILDGVDEIPEAIGPHRPRANLLTGLADALPAWHRAGHRVLLTSRPYGVDSERQQALGLIAAELAGLPDPLQTLFVQRWYAASGGADGAARADGLLQHVFSRADLAELRPNPMLLTALCVKYDEGQRLPGDVYKLYDSVVDQVLYKRFDTEPERQLARSRLEAVALQMHRGSDDHPRASPAATVSFDEIDSALARFAQTDPNTESGAVAVVERRELLLSNSGLLIPFGERAAGFYHLTFQEFLAAVRLKALQAATKPLLDTHAAQSTWRRTLTFLFAAHAEQRPEHALKQFAPLSERLAPEAIIKDAQPALLMASCLELGHARGWNLESFAAPLMRACEAMLRSADIASRAALWRALGTLGFDRRAGVGLDEDGLPVLCWRKIPAGRVTLEDDAGTHDVAEFHISAYPVTYGQYKAFLGDPGGFSDPGWWAGMPQPESFGEQAWPIDNHPAERVSWYDAVAFCRWLSEKRGFEIRLPTEWEWQQAATSANPEKEYPWGKGWRDAVSNTPEAGLGGTTAVGIFLDGDSRQQVSDLAGNVWEWCLNKYETSTAREVDASEDGRVVRGGSWASILASRALATATAGIPALAATSSVFGLFVSPPSFEPLATATLTSEMLNGCSLLFPGARARRLQQHVFEQMPP